MKQLKHALLAAALAASSGLAAASAVNSTSYAGINGSTATFNALGAGGDLLSGIVSSGGVQFGERFAGQALSVTNVPTSPTTQAFFDNLAFGTPASGLTLLAGADGANLGIYDYGDAKGNALVGIGPANPSNPDEDPWGNGAISARFATGQSALGFFLRDGDGGDAWLSLYRADGSLIQTLTLDLNLPDYEGYFAFAREGGVADIAGFSLWNSDSYYGIAIDDLRFGAVQASVPEPGSLLLLAAGLGAAGWARRRRS
ncbi:MAG TPA: PEP-CTERM sorting domain-containing protein [Burkholderiaceae bacterium]